MKILVTGAAGFIGSHLTDHLLSTGHTVVGLDNFDPFYPRATKESNIAEALGSDRFRLVEADIRQREEIETSLSGESQIDAIVHLAAKAGVRPSIEDPTGYQTTNVMGTQNLLEFARARGIKPFVLASSSSVYGVNPNVPWRETDTGLLPISPYASTKVSCELLGHVYSHLFGLRVTALRFFTVYGPRQRPDLAIHKFCRSILDGKPIPFFGDGTTRRDYTYVADIVSGVAAAVERDLGPYEVINIGNHHTVSLAEMVAEIEQALGRRAVLDRKPEQPGDVPQTWADIGKARSLLGYEPATPFGTGIAHFVDWLQKRK